MHIHRPVRATLRYLAAASALALLALPAAAQVLPGQAVPDDAAVEAPPASSVFADILAAPKAAQTYDWGAMKPETPAADSSAASSAPVTLPGSVSKVPREPVMLPEPPDVSASSSSATATPMPSVPSSSVATGPKTDAPVARASAESNLPAIGARFAGRPKVATGGVLLFDGQPVALGGGLVLPEPGRACYLAPVTWSCGDLAKRTLEKLVGDDRVVCVVTGAVGDIVEASCRKGRNDLSAAMVEAGMAKSDDPSLAEAAARARADRRGLWASERG